MSLYSKLGPQGRALLNQGNGHSFQPTTGPSYETGPQELDYLIHSLRNPSQDITIGQILSYMYHYLPFVKVEHNLRLVVASFLNNPTCFRVGGAPFEQSYQIIEAFKAITDKKLSISQPTLSIKSWYTIVLHELKNFVKFDRLNNSWKVLPIISGLLLSNELRDELYTRYNVLQYKWFFRDWDKQMMELYSDCLNHTLSSFNSDDIINLSLLSLSITYKKEDSLKLYASQVSNSFIVNRLIHLIFSNNPFSLQSYESFFYNPDSVKTTMSRPVVRHLNRLSYLLGAYFQELPINDESFELVMSNLTKIKIFNASLAELTHSSMFSHNDSVIQDSELHKQFWFFMKNLFFAESIIMQGLLTRFLNYSKFTIFKFFEKSQTEVEYRRICLKIIECFYHVNHILLEIGQGGFDAYNFIYYLCLEVILASKVLTIEFEKLCMFFIGYPNVNLNADILNNNSISRGRVLFVLGLWENYLQKNKSNNTYIVNNIFPVCFDLANDSRIKNRDIIEGCHSVLLSCFSDKHNNTNVKESINYVNLIISQFPSVLSATQLSIAIETLGKKILSSPIKYENNIYTNSVEEFLDFIYFKCFNVQGGIPINGKSSHILSSAQPIAEVGAESTLRSLENDHNVDIIDSNKGKKPKDNIKLDILPDEGKKEYNSEIRLTPETSREAMILSFINLIPYLPLNIFVKWLDKIFFLIDSSSLSEKEYLVNMLWKVLSENLDLNRCEIAYRWWYQTMKAVVSPLNILTINEYSKL